MAIRPYNPEGVQFIDEVESLEGKDGWFVNSRTEALLDRPADNVLVSDYASGDVFMRLMTIGPPSRGGPGAARLATATGQWPEAIHPQTLCGCMGDGQHGWAAAEWVMMIRNCFVREEGERLIVGSGLFAEWFDRDEELMFGPTTTPWRPVTVRISRPLSQPTLEIDACWRNVAPRIDVAIPAFVPIADVDACSVVGLKRESADFADVRR